MAPARALHLSAAPAIASSVDRSARAASGAGAQVLVPSLQALELGAGASHFTDSTAGDRGAAAQHCGWRNHRSHTPCRMPTGN